MQIHYSSVDLHTKKPKEYIRWIKEISELAKKLSPDIIHVLTGDTYLKYFGLGIGQLRNICPVIVTMHWCRTGKLKALSRLLISKKCDALVVHSDFLLEQIQREGISNGVCIDYPQFAENKFTKHEAKDRLGLNSNVPIISAIGNTRDDKGLDILLSALKLVNDPFQLLIAGKEETFFRSYIEENVKDYIIAPHLMLQYLTDEEFQVAIAASDVIVLPYKTLFNGASGPLVEGAYKGKCIIGSSHGNLGETIRRYHLGYTFPTENVEQLAQTIHRALKNKFFIDEEYKKYQRMINPKIFVERYRKLYSYCLDKNEAKL